jgi:hypothetical protein
MNWAWYDGRMSVEHYQEEHGRDSETVLKSVEAAAADHANEDQAGAAEAEETVSSHHQ